MAEEEGKAKGEGEEREEEEILTSLMFWDDVATEGREKEEEEQEEKEEEKEDRGLPSSGESDEGAGEWKVMVNVLCSVGIPLSSADTYAFRLFRCHVTTPVITLHLFLLFSSFQSMAITPYQYTGNVSRVK
jgi:hypothetical protein